MTGKSIKKPQTLLESTVIIFVVFFFLSEMLSLNSNKKRARML